MAIAEKSIYTGGAMSGVTDSHDVFVPQIWGPAVQKAFREKLVFGALCNDLSDMIAGGGDTINLPTIDTISSGDKTAEQAISYDPGAAVQTQETLTVNKHTYAACLIEDIKFSSLNKEECLISFSLRFFLNIPTKLNSLPLFTG